MMALANVLGLLGLLGVAVLIIIYIIKPNFQQKVVSSTFVWKLSLKYRRRRIPVNKLRNLLLILCQVLILTACALILSKPVIEAQEPEEFTEKIVIIDASANMKSVYDNETRFQRAIREVKDLANVVLEDPAGKITVIIASDEAYVLPLSYMDDSGEQFLLAHRLDATSLQDLNDTFDYILSDLEVQKDDYSTFGSGDIEGAMRLAEDVLNINAQCEVLLYTGNDYIDKGNVTVVNMRREGERNAAILDGKASINAQYAYTFAVDLAVYGQDVEVDVTFRVYGANSSLDNPSGKSEPITWTTPEPIACKDNEEITVEFDSWSEFNVGEDGEDIEDNLYNPHENTIYNFSYAVVEVSVANEQFVDVLPYDDAFYFYGGRRHNIKVQYASTQPNIFMNTVLGVWQQQLASRWNVVVNEVVVGGQIATEDYDIYIFEHELPEEMPEDGVVILLDPAEGDFASDLGISKAGTVDVSSNGWESHVPFEVEARQHEIMKHLLDAEIGSTRFVGLTAGSEWDTLMTAGNYPVLLMKNEPNSKVMVFSLDINYANTSMRAAFPLMMVDVFNYFFPPTLEKHIFEVGETVTFNCITDEMDWSSPSAGPDTPGYEPYTEFPASIVADEVGTYTLTQEMLSKETIVSEFYVKIPAKESNVFQTEDKLVNPYVENMPEPEDLDLLIYFAAALVALLFAEWWLQSRDQF